MASPIGKNAEMQLGLWCVEKTIQCGGVLEHPAGSKLWEAANLPMPNAPAEDPFLFSIEVEQGWWGYASRKKTWLLIAGVPKAWLPRIPNAKQPGQRAIATGSKFQRARTMLPFAEWLCQIARSTWYRPECEKTTRYNAI